MGNSRVDVFQIEYRHVACSAFLNSTEIVRCVLVVVLAWDLRALY